MDGVEIDPALEEVGRRYFDMGSNPNLTVHNEDARPWLRRADSGYDVIMVDAYRQPYIPFYLATREFFELARDRLARRRRDRERRHPEGNDDLEQVLGRTMSAVFPSLLRDPIEDTNTLLVASEARLGPPAPRGRDPRLPSGLRQLAGLEATRLGPRLPGGSVYTDDRAPVEWLIDRSILGYAATSERAR